MSDLWNFLYMKCLFYEMSYELMSDLWNFLFMKCFFYEMSYLWNVRLWNMSLYEMSYLWHVLSRTCPIYEKSYLWNVTMPWVGHTITKSCNDNPLNRSDYMKLDFLFLTSPRWEQENCEARRKCRLWMLSLRQH